MNNPFELDNNIIHLNHAAVGPWPVVTRDAVINFAKENASMGSQNYGLWMKTEQQLKQRMAQLVNAQSSDEIAILKNTSEGLSIIAQGLSFNTGDNIVIPAEEFPSNKVVWQALQTQGVELRLIAVNDSDEPEQLLIDAMDENTRLLSCSSVQFAGGLLLDINRIGLACKNNNTLFCVDAIQSLGAIQFDAQACHADFVVSDGHKWMCGPEGTALFYCRKSNFKRLTLRQHGWHMLKPEFYFSPENTDTSLENKIADTAQRFECGSPNMMGIAALNASLGLFLEIGIKEIESKLLDNTQYILNTLTSSADITIVSSTRPGKFAGIVTFYKHGVDNEKLYQHLQNNNVICAHRGGGIRFSAHFYTPQSAIAKALQLVFDFTE